MNWKKIDYESGKWKQRIISFIVCLLALALIWLLVTLPKKEKLDVESEIFESYVDYKMNFMFGWTPESKSYKYESYLLNRTTGEMYVDTIQYRDEHYYKYFDSDIRDENNNKIWDDNLYCEITNLKGDYVKAPRRSIEEEITEKDWIVDYGRYAPEVKFIGAGNGGLAMHIIRKNFEYKHLEDEDTYRNVVATDTEFSYDYYKNGEVFTTRYVNKVENGIFVERTCYQDVDGDGEVDDIVRHEIISEINEVDLSNLFNIYDKPIK